MAQITPDEIHRPEWCISGSSFGVRSSSTSLKLQPQSQTRHCDSVAFAKCEISLPFCGNPHHLHALPQQATLSMHCYGIPSTLETILLTNLRDILPASELIL